MPLLSDQGPACSRTFFRMSSQYPAAFAKILTLAASDYYSVEKEAGGQAWPWLCATRDSSPPQVVCGARACFPGTRTCRPPLLGLVGAPARGQFVTGLPEGFPETGLRTGQRQRLPSPSPLSTPVSKQSGGGRPSQGGAGADMPLRAGGGQGGVRSGTGRSGTWFSARLSPAWTSRCS